MKRHLLAGIAAGALFYASPGNAQLFGGLCNTTTGPCASLPQQVLDYARQAEQLAQELQTAENTLKFYLNAAQNTAQLPFSVYRNVTGDIQNIQGLINQATMLQGFAKQMLTNLGSATGYPDSQLGSAGWEVIVAKENMALSLAMTQAAKAIDAQGPQLTSDAATLAQLQQEAMSDDGRQKALQTMAGITATSASMTQKSQQTTAGTQQAMMTYFTAQADRQSLFDGINHVQLFGMRYGACVALAQTGYTSDACADISTGTTIAATTTGNGG